MISVGDAVCTTTPLAGRGDTLALAQAGALVRSLDEHGSDVDTVTRKFDRWCTDNIRPWFDDHRFADADRIRRWSGGEVDTTRRLPSDLIVAAAAADDTLRAVVEPYARMDALPASASTPSNQGRERYSRTAGAPPCPTGRPEPNWPNSARHSMRESTNSAVSRRPAVA
jgi:hypothetical protein